MRRDLEQCLRVMALDYRDPNVAPFEPEPLVLAYNALLANPQDHFQIGAAECAMEFISCPGLRGEGLLKNIHFADGFFTTFIQQGYCQSCQTQQIMVISLHSILILYFPSSRILSLSSMSSSTLVTKLLMCALFFAKH